MCSLCVSLAWDLETWLVQPSAIDEEPPLRIGIQALQHAIT